MSELLIWLDSFTAVCLSNPNTAYSGWVMWSGLCGWGSLCQRRCRRTQSLRCDPQTLLFYWRHGLQEEQSQCYCARMSNSLESRTNSRTDHYVRLHFQDHLPSFGCSYMSHLYLPLMPHHQPTPPPSNSVLLHSLYTVPWSSQICLDD